MTQASNLRIVFAGTPDFAVLALNRLIRSGMLPLAVLTQPDRRAGRGRKLRASPVKQAALEAGISVHQPATLKGDEIQNWIADLRPDLLIIVAYGLILPAQILQLPKFGCWNIHASLLPRWRGAAPIQRAIEAGDDETGVCIMQMDEGLDTGPLLAVQRTAVSSTETGGSLHDRLARMGAETLLKCLHRLAGGEPLSATEQSASGVTYAAKLGKAEAEIDWNQDALTLERKVRAFNPWPVAWCEIAGERTRIWSACALGSESISLPGEIIRADPQAIDIGTASGPLRLLQLQRPGGRMLSAAEYFNARALQLASTSKP